MYSLQENIIGVVGGMGPQAGQALFADIIRNTLANCDQEHLPVIVMSFPGQFADRTAFLNGDTAINPAHNIVRVIDRLETAGALTVGIACNTSHSPKIYDVVVEQLCRKKSRVQLLHMPLETCRYVTENFPAASRIGLMTTNGTYRSGIYRALLLQSGYEPIVPDMAFQIHVIHRMVYDPVFGIKSNPDKISTEVGTLWEKAMQYFRRRHCEAVVLGCTEFSLVSDEHNKDIRFVDSTTVLARALIRETNPDLLKPE